MSKLATEARWRDAEDLKSCARAWADKIGVRPKRIQLQRMSKKWGSCSSSGIVTYSKELLARGREFGEAVVVHELIHLKIRNHGRLFRSLLRAYMPRAEVLLNDGLMEGDLE